MAYEAWSLRDEVLRAGLPAGSIYHADIATDTLHVGAVCDASLVAVATVCRELLAEQPERQAWRLRGMAVLPVWRGRGLGTQLAGACIDHTIAHGGGLIWCTAREAAFPFYRALGFEVLGQLFTRSEYEHEQFAKMVRDRPGH
jgi:ribosomal protein S18 acetylase RimI-like enzyme